MAYYPLKVKDSSGNTHTVGDPRTSSKVDTNDSRLSDSRTPTGTAGGDLTGTYPSPTLGAVGTAGTYTKVTTDSKGRVTSGSTLAESDVPSLSPSKVTGTAVITTDARLSDARTPTDASVTDAKVATNAAIAQSKIASLTTDLAAKQNRVFEPATSGSISSNAVTLNLSSTNVIYVSATANFQVNVTNAPTTNDQAITVTVAVTQGATAGIANALTINSGAAETIKWQGGTVPTGSGNGKIDLFSFTLLRRSGAWTVLGSALGNF